MSSMITAKEALALPNARLSESDREAAKAFLRRLDRYARDNVNYAGCDMPILTNEVNGPILAFVGRACLKAGWSWQVQQRQVPSGLIGGQPVAATFFVLRPKEEAYAAAEGEAADVVEDGPRESLAAVLGERFPRFVEEVLATWPYLAPVLGAPFLTPVQAAQARATLALVPEDRVERVTDAALRFCTRLGEVCAGLLDEFGRDDVVALYRFIVAKCVSRGVGRAVDEAAAEKVSREGSN